jgi:hypothetical protein
MVLLMWVIEVWDPYELEWGPWTFDNEAHAKTYVEIWFEHGPGTDAGWQDVPGKKGKQWYLDLYGKVAYLYRVAHNPTDRPGLLR